MRKKREMKSAGVLIIANNNEVSSSLEVGKR
jgi:hypothetical protein